MRRAANFLRERGIKFNGDNFYEMVLKNINELDSINQNELKEIVDWIEDYEITDTALYGHQPAPARFKNKKAKTATRKGSSSQRFPAQNIRRI